MSFAAGCRLGPYEIVSPLGAGGMGEVYRARDTRLGREVAVKVLPAEVARDPERLRRFEQEARAASALNHPHILTIHDVGADAGTSYLVTELLEGESLRELLRKGPLPVRRAVELTSQIARGLAAAHERGIVHRDLKPENLFLTRDGVVKILDFGLARLAAQPASASELARAPTVEALTGEGTVLGTVGYMSPEQVRGERADARSDLFALGCVLYELATGRRAFARETSAETLTAILRDEPAELDSQSSRLPPALRRIVRRALAKEPANRFPSARELALQLAESSESERDERPRRSLRMVAAVGVVALLAALLAIALRRESAPPGTTTSTPRIASIAVLPLENLSGESELDYLRLALADAMTTLLARTPSLAVRPFTRSRALTAALADPAEAGRELHAAAVLTGHLLAEGSELRLALEAFDVAENRVLWRQSFAVARSDLLALDREVARRLEEELLPTLGFASARRAPGAVPSRAEAYETFLRAVSRPYLDPSAIELLERSVALDSAYAPAWAELGYRLYQEAHFGRGGEAGAERSLVAYQRALALDPESIEAAAGFVFGWTEAGELESAYDSAAALVARRPDSAVGRAALAYPLRYGGLHDAAAAVCDDGLRLDRRETRLGHCAWIALERGEAERAHDFMRARSDSDWHRFVELFLALHAGDRERARRSVAALDEPSWGVDFVAAYLGGAPRIEIRRRLESFLRSGFRAVVDGDIDFRNASLAAFVGEPDAALDMLRRSLERRFCAVTPLAHDPLLAPLRGRPEFEEIRRDAEACRDRFVAHLRAVDSPYAPP